MYNIISKLKQKTAFSLQEMLIVVAIIVVLFAIGAPLVVNAATELKMQELDDHAKSIYLEAQNQLMTKKIEGGLPAYYDQLKTEEEAQFLAYQVGGVNEYEKPGDFPDPDDDVMWKELAYLVKADDLMKEIIDPKSNVYQSLGNYLIEFNPQTGDIYGVFYWEKNEAIVYKDDIEPLGNRDRDQRKSSKIGYYGGKYEGSASPEFLEQRVELINEEELYLKVSFRYFERLVDHLEDLTITCEMKDEHGHTIEKVLNKANRRDSDRMEFYFLLDSMETGYGFEELFCTGVEENKKLVPGDQITIRVKSELGGGAYISAISDPITTNSLFASKTENADGTTIELSSIRHLRNLDQDFYNYEKSRLLVDNSNPDVKKNPNKKVTIQQTGNIDFNSKTYAWGGGIYKGKGSGTRPIDEIHPIVNNDLLLNDGVVDPTTSYKDYTVVQGNGFKMQNLVVKADAAGAGNVGIFSLVSHMDFDKVLIEDITVTGETSNNVGALAGGMDHCEIKNSGVFLSIFEMIDGAEDYYCLRNSAISGYANDMDRRYDTICITGAENVGGFAGVITNSTVENSFAAIKAKGKINVGGFVGHTTDSNIKYSYASGNVHATNGNCGGFIGVATKVNVSGSYTTGDVYADTKNGGYVGKSTESTYTDCRVYGKVLKANGNNVTVDTKSGGFIAKTNSSTDTFTNCVYLKQIGYNATGLTDPTSITNKEYWQLMAKDPSELLPSEESEMLPFSASYPYADYLLWESFPFKKLEGQTSHYGNWPKQNVINSSLVYYERYSDGTYGYYTKTVLSNEGENHAADPYVWMLDTLKNDKIVVEDGYALLSSSNLASFKYAMYTDNKTDKKTRELWVVNKYTTDFKDQALFMKRESFTFNAFDKVTGADKNEKFTVNGMFLYKLPYQLQNNDRSSATNFYDKLVIYDGKAKGNAAPDAEPVLGGKTEDLGITYYYCPDFAKTAVNPHTPGAPSASEPNPKNVYVRSARQLNRLGLSSCYWGYDIRFKQEIPVDFAKYDKKYCGTNSPLVNKPIGTKDKSFSNPYDGGGNPIYNYSIESSNRYVGLFGKTTDVIKNVVMTVKGTEARIIKSNYAGSEDQGVGALVGYAVAKVENSTASGYQVVSNVKSSARSSATGGLIGYSSAEVTHCTAVNDVKVNASNKITKKVFAAGLVGSCEKGGINNSYAGGTLDLLGEAMTDAYVAGICPGVLLQNGNSAGTVTYKNLYSYVNMLKLDASKYKELFATVGKTGATIGGNCYYLADFYGWKNVSDNEAGEMVKYSELEAMNKFGVSVSTGCSFPTSSKLAEKKYPFKTVLTYNGKHVHYGDWPLKRGAMAVSILYYEKYYDVDNDKYSIGLYFIDHLGVVQNTLTKETSDEKIKIVEYGYGYSLLAKDDTKKDKYIGIAEADGETYHVYAKNEKLYGGSGLTSEKECVFGEGTENEFKVPLYVNDNFGAAISKTPDLGKTEDNPLQVRGPGHVDGMGGLDKNVQPAYLEQTRDLDMTGHTSESLGITDAIFSTNRVLHPGHHYDGGSENGCQIKNAETYIFSGNEGFVENCYVTGAKGNGSKQTAIFIESNKGPVTNCIVTNCSVGSIDSTQVAGFIWSNDGDAPVTKCKVLNSIVRGHTTVGFIGTNNGDGNITECEISGNTFYTGQMIEKIWTDNSIGTRDISYKNNTVKGRLDDLPAPETK